MSRLLPMLTRAAVFAAALFFASPLLADEFVTVVVGGSSPATTTIGVTNTFQTIINASTPTSGAPLHGCSVQNKSTDAMSIYPAVAASATAAGSLTIAAGNTFYCSDLIGHISLNAFSLTGTSGDSYAVWTW